jgi:hypothetical protein
VESKENRATELPESEKPIGQGDKLGNAVQPSETDREPVRSIPYGDMDQPGMNPDIEDSQE